MPGRLEPEPLPRRDFLGLAGLWTTGVAILGSIIGMIRLPKPTVLPEAATRFRLGRPEDFPAGSERVLPDKKVLVVSREEGVAAISMVCTHLGCIVARTEDGFACPCHGSRFNSAGKVVGGPAPRGLRWLEVSQSVDGRLVVDAGREVAPETFYSV
ncbi:MAG: ubiquinol-cytochrome c reductase iron-sulfur subunit [Deltaproteobacteria bacterium]|nr:MAG: ubiquinol-cytochrome c reductase iron-sulfur subunit [Deltaproteobacteria bacterium]